MLLDTVGGVILLPLLEENTLEDWGDVCCSPLTRDLAIIQRLLGELGLGVQG